MLPTGFVLVPQPDMNMVLAPHLLSLANGIERVHAEFARLAGPNCSYIRRVAQLVGICGLASYVSSAATSGAQHLGPAVSKVARHLGTLQYNRRNLAHAWETAYPRKSHAASIRLLCDRIRIIATNPWMAVPHVTAVIQKVNA